MNYLLTTQFTHSPQTATHFHCIGIGGIGVSALARLLFMQKKIVTGSDVTKSEATLRLTKLGISVTHGPHNAANLPANTQVVIYSPAILQDNPERIEARERKILEISYPEMVGHIMSSKMGIAVAGTHGKTTTTALIGHIITQAKLDPTILVGSFSKDLHDANSRLGKGDIMVVEADEYKASFLNYKPKIIVCTNIEEDHLDYYRDLSHILATFEEFILRMPGNGLLIAYADDPNVEKLCEKVKTRIMRYGISKGEVRASSIRFEKSKTCFNIEQAGQVACAVTSPLYGIHNVANVLAAYCCARQLKISPELIAKAIKKFKGVWRRFEVIFALRGITVIDDYAHHPTEIKALINALRQAYPRRRCIMVFQPHQEDRFVKLFNDFASAFAGADEVLVTEIYRVEGRRLQGKETAEQLIPHIISHNVSATFCPTFSSIVSALHSRVEKGDIVVFVGAGDIIEARKQFVQEIEKT